MTRTEQTAQDLHDLSNTIAAAIMAACEGSVTLALAATGIVHHRLEMIYRTGFIQQSDRERDAEGPEE